MTGPQSINPDGSQEAATTWRRQFPVDTAAEARQTRREFVAGTAIAGGVMACGRIGLELISPSANSGQLTEYPPAELPAAAADLQTGEALVFHFPDAHSPCLLIRTEDAFTAFTQKCTHLACPVVPNPDAQTLDCPCHQGAFSMRDGAPISGPPRSGLSRVILEQREGTWVATGIRTPGSTTAAPSSLDG